MELFDKGMQGKGTLRVWEARLVMEGELKSVRKGEVCLPHSCQSAGPEVAATAWAEVKKGQVLARVQIQRLLFSP